MNYYNYFTEIEEHFVKRRGKHLLVSPLDWGLIASWRDAGVPLNVAIRGIDIAMDGHIARQGKSKSRVNGLCYCHEAVMEAYAAHIESRVGEASAEDSPGSPAAEEDYGKKEVSAFLFEKIGEIQELQAKQYGLNAPENIERISARLEEIVREVSCGRPDTEALERDLAILDNLLVSELRTLVTEDEEAAWVEEAKKELKVYKKRLPKETYEKIRENFFRDKVRRKFHVGELSLFRI